MNFDSPFSRSEQPSAVAPCKTACVAKRQSDDTLFAGVQLRIKALTGRSEPATAREPGDDGPVMMSADDSPCQRQANQLGSTLRRFNRYREALPFGEAANDMSNTKKARKGANPLQAPQPPASACLTRLSGDGPELCRQLGIPADAITTEDLNNPNTGFLASVYRDEANNRLILVANDTDPQSLVDWKTNLENSEGLATDQYNAAYKLAKKLSTYDVKYDISGYSKGGGMGQMMGLVNPDAKVMVFNSAGLPMSATASADKVAALAKRTTAYSAEGDLLTYMNETRDPAQLVQNAEYLKKELLGQGSWLQKMRISYRNPENPDAAQDADYAKELTKLTKLMDDQIEQVKRDGLPPPPVRADYKEVVKGSLGRLARVAGAGADRPNLGKQYQHLMGNVLEPIKANFKGDREALESFLENCG